MNHKFNWNHIICRNLAIKQITKYVMSDLCFINCGRIKPKHIFHQTPFAKTCGHADNKDVKKLERCIKSMWGNQKNRTDNEWSQTPHCCALIESWNTIQTTY